MNLDDLFEEAHQKFLSHQIITKESIGRRRNNSSASNSLTYSSWIKSQFESLEKVSKEREVSLSFDEAQLFDYVKVSLCRELENSLRGYMNASFHSESIPTLDRKNLDLPFTLTNLQVISWEDKRKNWNIWFSKQKENQHLDLSKKSVVQLDKESGKEIKIFPSISEAKKAMGATGHDNRITEVCEGKREEVYGFKWKFQKEEKSFLF